MNNNTDFIVNPYVKGAFIKKSIADSQFQVFLHGRAEFIEDDPNLGTFFMNEVEFKISSLSTLTKAVQSVEQLFSKSNPDFLLQDDLVGFDVEHITIRDRYDCLVLGAVLNQHSVVQWIRPIKDELLRNQIDTYAERMNRKASSECGWDNYATARLLRSGADKLLLAKTTSLLNIENELNRLPLVDLQVH